MGGFEKLLEFEHLNKWADSARESSLRARQENASKDKEPSLSGRALTMHNERLSRGWVYHGKHINDRGDEIHSYKHSTSGQMAHVDYSVVK